MKHFGIHNHNRHIACGMSKFQPVHKHNMLHHAHNIQKASSPCADFYQSAKPASNPQPFAQNAGQSQGAQQNFWQQLMGFLSGIFGGGSAAQSWESSTQALTGGAAAASAGGAQATQEVQTSQKSFNERYDDAIIQFYQNWSLITSRPNIRGTNDGGFTRESLQAFLNNNADLPPELRESCQFLLNNPAAFDKLDISKYGSDPNHKIDGHVGRLDVEAAYDAIMHNK